MKANHTSQQYRLEDDISKVYPHKIAVLKERIEGLEADIGIYEKNKPEDKETFLMKVDGTEYTERKDAGSALIGLCKNKVAFGTSKNAGEFLGMKMQLSYDYLYQKFNLALKGKMSHNVELGADPSGNITRITNILEGMSKELDDAKAKLENTEKQLEIAKSELL